MAGWESPLMLLKEELIQRRDEGCDIPSGLIERIDALDPEKELWDHHAVDPLYDELMSLEPDADLAAREPSALEEIQKLRPDGPRRLALNLSENELLDRFHGAWTGRAAGCALGKPVEVMGMKRENGALVGRKRIKAYLQNRNDWPLEDYFSQRDAGDGITLEYPASMREHIAYMEPDDDIHYTLTALGVLEEHGFDFTWRDVAQYWCWHIPIRMICTAETQAMMNLLNTTRRGELGVATPEFTRRYRNPYREWIGAQIRADGWAWTCAGMPEYAATLAYRDACWTHERNGIYGEMFCAAMQAAAFVEYDPHSLVHIGLSEIPADCRLARAVHECLEWVARFDNFEDCMDKLEQTYPGERMAPAHTINNALICVLSLFYGRMHTRRSIATAVMCGLDTDCNGATVGSIVGALHGRLGFDETLAGPLNDTIRPNITGFTDITMAELARRTMAVHRQLAD